MGNDTIIVTRHAALVAYMTEIGLVGEGASVVAHANAEVVEGKNVIGVLPLELAAKAASITEVPLRIPAEMRGQELTLEQVRQYAGEPVTYRVTVI